RDAAQAALLLVDLVGDRVRIEPRALDLDAVERPAVLLAERGPPRPDVHELRPHDEPAARPLHIADDDTVRAELLPAIDRELVDRRGARHRRRGVLRDHVELALEVQVVPE